MKRICQIIIFLFLVSCLFYGCGCMEGKWGFIDASGKVVVDFKYAEVKSFSNGLAVVFNEDGRAGLVDHNGKEILSPRYSDISDLNGDYAYFVIRDDSSGRIVETYGFLDRQGKVVSEEKFSYVKFIYKDIAAVKKDYGQYFLTRIGGGRVGDMYFVDISEFKDDYAVVEIKGKYGVIDYTGKIVIPVEFVKIRDYQNGFFVASKVGRNGDIMYGLIDKNGETVIDFEYSDIVGPSEGFITYKIGNLYGIMDLSGRIVLEPEYELLSEVVNTCALFCKANCDVTQKLYDYDRARYYGNVGYVCINKKDNIYEIIKKELGYIYSASVFSNGRAEICEEKGRCYIINNKFEQLSSDEYSVIRDYFEGLSFACKECNYDYGEWFLLDIYGKQVTKKSFKQVMDFSEGLAAVVMKEEWNINWSFIDRDGEVVIEGNQYDIVKSFKEGRAAVCKGLCERLGGGH